MLNCGRWITMWKFTVIVFTGYVGSLFQGIELRHSEFYYKVQLPDGSLLPLSQRFLKRQRQTLVWKDHRVRADSGYQIQDHNTRFEFSAASAFRTTGKETSCENSKIGFNLWLNVWNVQDIGGSLPNTVALENVQTDVSSIYNTNASETLKNQLSDVLDFLADFHTLSKVKVIEIMINNIIFTVTSETDRF